MLNIIPSAKLNKGVTFSVIKQFNGAFELSD
jgi:hypothetical protein